MKELLADLESVTEQARCAAISQRLSQLYPDKKIYFSDSSQMFVGAWAAETKEAQVTIAPEFSLRKLGVREGFVQRMRRRELGTPEPVSATWHVHHGLESFTWKGHHVEVFTVQYLTQYEPNRWSWLVSDDEALLRELFATVVAWNSEVHGEVLSSRMAASRRAPSCRRPSRRPGSRI